MNAATITAAEVLRQDAFEIFGVAAMEPLQSVADNGGALADATAQAIERLGRKLCYFFHPDRNPAGRDAFEKIRECGEMLRDPPRCLAALLRRPGIVSRAAAATNAERAAHVLRARAAGAKLEKQIAAEAELRRQQQARAAAELQANLQRMRTDAQPKVAEAVERERRAQMSEWERLQEAMLDDWDVDAATLLRKQDEVAAAMRYLSGAAEAAAVRRPRGVA